MDGVSVSIDEPRFVWAVVVCLCGADGEVSDVACYCTAHWDVAGVFVVCANSAEADGLILLDECNLEVAVW